MAKQLYANSATAMLAASISDADLTIQVASGFGALFPNPGADEYFLVTLENANGDREIVRCSSRSSDLITVATGGRGQEGTSAQSWTSGQARVECRLTAGTLRAFLQRGGDQMEGDLDMDENEVQNAILTGLNTQILAGEIVGVPLRGAEGDSSNEIAVPGDGSRATAGGAAILTEDDDLFAENAVFPAGMIMMWYGASDAIPSGWALCNGSNGTPDLRGRFPIGVNGTYTLGATGGAASASGNTGNAGGHSHGGSTGSTVLTEEQIPEHNHRLFTVENSGTSDAKGWNRSGVRGIPGDSDGPFGYRDMSNSGDQLIENAGGGGGGHDHTIAAVSDHAHSINVATLPPYVGVHFIMKL